MVRMLRKYLSHKNQAQVLRIRVRACYSMYVQVIHNKAMLDDVRKYPCTCARGTTVAGYARALHSAATVQTARAAIGAWRTVATTS